MFYPEGFTSLLYWLHFYCIFFPLVLIYYTFNAIYFFYNNRSGIWIFCIFWILIFLGSLVDMNVYCDCLLGITELLAPLCNQANMLVKNESLWRGLLSQHLISLSLALINKKVKTLSSNFLWLVLKWTPCVRLVQLGSKSNAWSVCKLIQKW